MITIVIMTVVEATMLVETILTILTTKVTKLTTVTMNHKKKRAAARQQAIPARTILMTKMKAKMGTSLEDTIQSRLVRSTTKGKLRLRCADVHLYFFT